MSFNTAMWWSLLASFLTAWPVDAQATSWHVSQAELRFPVVLDRSWLAPADIYLADLPIQAGKDLVFEPTTKEAKTQVVDKKDKLVQRVRGEAVFAVKPDFKWLTFKMKGKVRVFADGIELKMDKSSEGGHYRLPIPSGSRTLKIQADCNFFTEAGFLTAGPKVARTTLYLPGQDPTQVVPLVYTEEGRQVGAVTLWAHPGEPWMVLFDCSSGSSQYFLYPVDRKYDLVRPTWTPQAGLILETRYLDYYDPKVKTLDGFQELWKQSTYIAGKMNQGDVWRSFLPCRPRHADVPNIKAVPRGAPLALARYLGYFRLPGDDEYRFHFRAWPGGFLVIDGQTVIELGPSEANALLHRPKNPHKIVALKLSAGPHRLEAYQYGQHGQFHVSLGWSTTRRQAPHLVGHDVTFFEPIVPANVQGVKGREADKMLVNFTWSDQGNQPGQQCLGQWPAEDIVGWQFTSQFSPPADGVVFRWRFDDGGVAEGQSVTHLFCRTGQRQVALEAVAGKTGMVLASRTGTVHVQVRWDWPEGHPFHQVADEFKKRAGEFATVTPIEEVLSLHAWACQDRRQELRDILGNAVSKRLDEVLAKTADDRLFHLGLALAEAEERRYGPAEKILRAALAQSPLGSFQKKNAALALAEFLTGVAGKPETAQDLLNQVETERPEVDLTAGWKVAPEATYPPDLVRTPLPQLLDKITWQSDPKSFTGKLPLGFADKTSLGLWLSKEVVLDPNRPQKPLVLDLGRMSSEEPGGPMPSPGMIWFNGEALGEPWRWREARVVVPAKLVRSGTNQLVLLLLAPAPAEFYPKGQMPSFHIQGPGRAEDQAARFQRARADILIHLGKLEESRNLLQGVLVRTWPLEDAERVRLVGQLRSIRRLAGGPGGDPDNAMEQLDTLLYDYPLLRLDPEVMVARVETHLGRKEYQRALVLAEQMLRLKDQSELTRRQFLLAQVQANALQGQFEAARKIYKNLTDLSPYSPETIRARETIIRALPKGTPSDLRP